jgi:metal-responsive CopG/Arc/MetJ family transcriptional regulator
LSDELVAELDRAAQAEFMTRSSFVREAIMFRLRADRFLDKEISEQLSDFNIIKRAQVHRLTSRSAQNKNF